MNLLKDLERTETEYMRLKRHKICADDFHLLTIIGRGAFGEVSSALSVPMNAFFHGFHRRAAFAREFSRVHVIGQALPREEIRQHLCDEKAEEVRNAEPRAGNSLRKHCHTTVAKSRVHGIDSSSAPSVKIYLMCVG